MLLIKITNSDGSNPIILENVENISYSKSINLSEEGVSFEVAKNSPKADILNPDSSGYKLFWEVWDTNTNSRKNFGPLTSITENGPNWKVTGSGRSALLRDFTKTLKTFYASIDTVFDDLRYENIAVQPRASTIVWGNGAEAIVGTVTVNEKYQGLSKNSKDNAIDDDIGYFKPGKIEPPNTFYTTNSFWAGQSKVDNLVVDLGGTYNLSKVSLFLPWWGGPDKLFNRSYDFAVDYATESPNVITYKDKTLSSWTEIYSSPNNNRIADPFAFRFYLGTSVSGTSVELGTIYALQNITGPLSARYLRVRIRDVHAWYGTIFDNVGPHDGYNFQCSPSYSPGDDSFFASKHGSMENKVINDRELEPSNDCLASVVELGAYQQIIGRDTVKPLALQRIDDNNLQITYYHIPDASETITTDNGFRKFEPGGFFRKFNVTYSGASTSFSKFFDSDCANCYPDGHNFAIMDQHNTLIYATDSTSGTGVQIKAPAYSNTVLMKGASNAVVTYVDSWPAVTDPFSWGGSHSYSEKANDYLTVHFRGESFKWYATVPDNKTGATVKIEIRSKSAPNFTTEWTTSAWGSWSTLENSLTLPNNISAELVYEISFESGILLPETVYEIKITNLDGNYCSVDSFEGYWSGSLTQYNEDNNRIFLNDVSRYTQIYDPRFSGGSMYKVTKASNLGFVFVGDRIILYGAKSAHAGILSFGLARRGYVGSQYDDPASKINIPGSDANRILKINLRTGKTGNEITQAVLFDSNDYFPDGLPWDRYSIGATYAPDDVETYNGIDTEVQDSFTPRCSDCNPPTGDTIAIPRPIYLDGVAAHESIGLSLSFDNETHLDIAKSVIEALQIEGDITDRGLLITPRLGDETNEVLREGHNTLVDYDIVNDISQIASMLVSNGSDIDGLPLFTITEDKKTREDLGRTVMRKEDFRDIADYFQLVGLSRTSLRKRKKPEKRITITHIAQNLNLEQGDSFTIYTKKQGPLRVRINTKTISQTSSGGTTFTLECVRWPQII